MGQTIKMSKLDESILVRLFNEIRGNPGNDQGRVSKGTVYRPNSQSYMIGPLAAEQVAISSPCLIHFLLQFCISSNVLAI